MTLIRTDVFKKNFFSINLSVTYSARRVGWNTFDKQSGDIDHTESKDEQNEFDYRNLLQTEYNYNIEMSEYFRYI
jgi:hypothetical protein